MRHDLTFFLAGPPIGAAVCFFLLLPLTSVMGGGSFDISSSTIVSYFLMLPFAYLFGLIPATLVCVLDAKLIRYGAPARPAWCALFGFLMGFLPLAPSFLSGFIHGPYLLAFGLVGAVPGGACSWWANRRSDSITSE